MNKNILSSIDLDCHMFTFLLNDVVSLENEKESFGGSYIAHAANIVQRYIGGDGRQIHKAAAGLPSRAVSGAEKAGEQERQGDGFVQGQSLRGVS